MEDEPPVDEPLVLPVPDVAAGADAGDSVAAEGLLDIVPLGVVVLGDVVLLLGEVVLGVVVVLDGLLVSFLPQPYSATARIANAKACFTISVPSNVTAG